jgi:hypothetical protein
MTYRPLTLLRFAPSLVLPRRTTIAGRLWPKWPSRDVPLQKVAADARLQDEPKLALTTFLGRQRPTGEAPVGRPALYLRVLSKGKRVLDVDPEIPHGALDFHVPQQKPHRPRDAGRVVDD